MVRIFLNSSLTTYITNFISFSHQICRNSALANALAAQGHNVTVASPDRDKNPPDGVHYIHFEGVYDGYVKTLQKGVFDLQTRMHPLTETINYDNYWFETCKGN